MRTFGGVFLLFTLALGLTAADEGPSERLRLLILADMAHVAPSQDRWPDLSPEALHRGEASDRMALAKLHSIDREQLNRNDRTAFDVFEWRLNRHIEQFRLQLYVTPFWDDDRYQGAFGLLATAALFRQVSPQKLASYPTYVEQVIALLREGIRRKMLPSQELVISIRSTCVNLNRPSISPEARKAADQFCEFLIKEYQPACPVSRSLKDWPNGAEVYRELVRRITTTELDPQQLYEFGLKEVARIRAAMLPVIARAGYQGTLDEFLQYARTDPRFYFATSDELFSTYRAAVDRIEPLVPRVVGHIPPGGVIVQRAQGEGAAAMWQRGQSGHLSATVRVAVTDPSIHPKFEIIPLMLHEGTPGHDLQHAVEDEVHAADKDSIAVFVHNNGRSLAFVEGWGLYSEGLGRDLGLYHDPYDEFGLLRMELSRAVRVVIDTGIHAQGWSVVKAKEYYLKQTGKPESEVDGEIRRTVEPASILAYKVGQLRIQAMRQDAEHALGRQFDPRRFHDAILRWGPLPLDVLKRKLDDCLAAADCASELRSQN